MAFLLQISTLRADEWHEIYRQGISDLNRGEWARAEQKFLEGLQIKSAPETQAATSGLTMVDYLPHYYLGQAYFYSSQYERALSSFERSVSAAAVERTENRRHLQQLIEVTRRLIESVDQDKKKTRERDLKNRTSSIQSLIGLRKFGEADYALNSARQEHPDDEQLFVLEKWLESEEARENFSAVGIDSEGPADRFFKQGLDHYVSGQYEQALAAFQSAFTMDQDFSRAREWIQKTETELRRLRADESPKEIEVIEPQIIERTITRSVSPLFAIRTPSEVRTGTVTLAGRVRDDQGIERIDVALNGKAVVGPAGERLTIRPAGGTDPTRLSFSFPIPLQLGENTIVLTAYDVDSPQKRTIERFVVTRKVPIYQTSIFAMGVAAIVLVLIGAVITTRMVKYRLAIVNKYNPYIAGSPIRNEEMFFGREKLITRIMNTLHNNSLLIYGPRRIGKTSLQHQLKRRLQNSRDPEFHFVPVLIDLQGTSEERFFATLMEEILEACKTEVNGGLALRFASKKDHYMSRDFSRDIKQVINLLQSKHSAMLKLVLLIDEVDELNKYSEQVNQKLRSIFMKTYAEHLVAVMSGSHIRKSWESEGSPWYNFFEEIEVPPFDRADAIELIRKPVSGIFSYENDAIVKIIEYSDCKPYIIQKFCVNVINEIIEAKRRRVTVDDVNAVARVVSRSLEE